ncbi:MAG TPA: RNA-binding domain-containing protein, partial [Acidobacteriota bacterium]|nr:RNA-binding domain-containing protein [Acidobacteriota bacterium]
VTTHLKGRETRFLPFNQGYDFGAGNPPARTKYATAYLWERIWAKDSVLNLIQHFIHLVTEEKADSRGRRKTTQLLLFPRYHQLDAVRKLVSDARSKGPGQQYLIEHSAGSGKSFTISWLSHWLSVLHDAQDEKVFDSVIVITDRRVLDAQLQESVWQFEQTPGVVERIEGTSQQLKAALEQGKQIIITTLQKFPVIVDDITELPGNSFAIIVDEAHSSQTGESTKALKKVLSASTLEEAEQEEGGEQEDLEDRIVAEMKTRGRLPNASFFAFTATPKPKTLELFGRRREDGEFEAFSLYSMRQAIEENFILDVLENYTTYNTYWRLLKKIEDDPHYDRSKAQSLLKRFVDLAAHTIRQKVEIMVEHFREHVQNRIEGKAKAMIVTRSRLHAVRFKQALDAYLREQRYPFKSLVAFSGTVHDQEKGGSFTETGMNGGIPESRTAKTFDQPGYRFLVVAAKFQTGFDQPLLHTMYVDKKLGGVNAVQTLSRLNRTHPGKHETMVLDFANEADQIQKAFEPYYRATRLSGETDPNLLYDRQDDLEDYGLFSQEEVDAFAGLFFNAEPQEKLYAALRPVKERTEERLDDDELKAFRSCLKDYARLYSFLSQILSFADADLEKLYVFAKLLHRFLKAPKQELPRDIQEKIDMDALRIQPAFRGKIGLEGGEEHVQPISGGLESLRGAGLEQIEPLSQIIEELNQRFGADLTDEDRITVNRVMDRALEDEALRKSVEVNAEDNARLAFANKLTDLLGELIDTNFKLYKRINDDQLFQSQLVSSLFEEYRKRIKNGGLTEADVVKEIRAGENKHVEFKSSLRFNVHTEQNDKRLTHSALKTIAAFQNSEGGTLYIGVADDGEIAGIEQDGFPNEDKFLLHLNNVVKDWMGQSAAARIDPRIWILDGKAVCRVQCPPSPKPVYLKFQGKESFYVRTGPSTEEMTLSEMQSYVGERFGLT